MKKMMAFMLGFFMFSISLNASCNYSDIKERNALASYVDYNIEFNESNQKFNIVIYNLKDSLKVNYNGNILNTINGESKIDNIDGGTSIKVNIVSEDDCYGKTFRIININVPYINNFYNRSECKGHEELKVCSSKYLDYELSENAFINLINKEVKKINKKENINDDLVKETFFEKIMNFFKKVYVPFILVIMGSLLSSLIFNPIYRKTKHGI